VTSVADDVKRLGDPDPSVRDAAAKSIRDANAKDAKASGDPGEEHWRLKLAFVELGISMEQLEKETGGKCESGISSGGSTTVIFRLDDYWVVQAFFNNYDSDRLFGIRELSRRTRSVWVDPPTKNFTGKWVTYFVNGFVSHEIEYAAGVYRRFRAYYDNTQLMYEQVYVDGEADGPEIGWHKDGKKAYEIRYQAGKETGQARWDEQGKLLFARGTASDAK
jgi:hypothetical protein